MNKSVTIAGFSKNNSEEDGMNLMNGNEKGRLTQSIETVAVVASVIGGHQDVGQGFGADLIGSDSLHDVLDEAPDFGQRYWPARRLVSRLIGRRPAGAPAAPSQVNWTPNVHRVDFSSRNT